METVQSLLLALNKHAQHAPRVSALEGRADVCLPTPIMTATRPTASHTGSKCNARGTDTAHTISDAGELAPSGTISLQRGPIHSPGHRQSASGAVRLAFSYSMQIHSTGFRLSMSAFRRIADVVRVWVRRLLVTAEADVRFKRELRNTVLVIDTKAPTRRDLPRRRDHDNQAVISFQVCHAQFSPTL
jgi:hypothetical protein